MEHSAHPLDRHFNLPHIRQVGTDRPLYWLKLGWADLREHAFASITYGLFFAVLGYLIVAFAAPRPYLVTVAVSGFFLIGPIAAAGLYEISRRSAAGRPAGLGASLRGIVESRDSLFSIGIFLALMMIAWERISAILFALTFQGELAEVSGFLGAVLLSGQHLGFTFTYLAVGALFAVIVFALSVVAIPMLMDRDVDMVTAMMTSLRTVAENPRAMAVWAATIVILVAIGFATMMIGLIILLPLLGHATWHAYKDLVE